MDNVADAVMVEPVPTQKYAEKEEARITPHVVFTCVMAGTGGLMYGYDLVIAGGISIMDDFLLKFYPSVYIHKKNAKLDNYCKYNNPVFQLFSSTLYLAALLAAFFGCVVSRKAGRRVSMQCAGMFFIIGTVVGTAAQNLAMLIIGRALLGCGIGFATQAVPIYIAEIAPISIRGTLSSLFGLYIGIGIVAGSMVNYAAAKVHPWGWRLSLGIAGIPALLLTFCSLSIVETPSSLIERGHHEQAIGVLRRIRGRQDVSEEFEKLVEALSCATHVGSSVGWQEYRELLCERRHRSEVVWACLMPFFQQVAGNDAIMFYGSFLFKLAGFGDQASLYSTVIISACSLVFGCCSILVIDKVGRRPLLLLGCMCMLSSQVVIGSIFGTKLKGNVRELPQSESVVEVVMVCLFVSGFSLSLGPLAWVIPSEILSYNVRSAGQSLVVLVNMLFKFIIAQTFLSMLCAFKFGTFFFFGGWVVVIGTTVLLFLPETKQVPLYKMETLWQSHWFWKRIVLPPSSHN